MWPIQINHFAKDVEHLEKHAKMTANNQMQPKILSLLIYEVSIDNTLDRAVSY